MSVRPFELQGGHRENAMGDHDESDDSFLERHHHLMHLYRNPLLTSAARRGSGGGGLVALILVIWGLYLLIREYWQAILLVLLAIAGAFALVFLAVKINDSSNTQEIIESEHIPSQAEAAAIAIRNTIRSTPKLGRYAWSAYDCVLLEQWNCFAAAGVTPPRRKTLARKAVERDRPAAKPPLLSRKAQAILAEIAASPRLAQHAWSTDESGLLEQWQRYQSFRLLPIRRSKLEKRLTRAAGANADR